MRLAIAGLFILLMLACDHSPLGFDQLERGVDEPKTSLPLVRAESRSFGQYDVNNPRTSAENLVLGRNYAYESRVLLQFMLADSAPKIDSVDSVKLTLQVRKPHRLAFNVFAITADWDETQTTWYDSRTAEPWFPPRNGGSFNAESLLASAIVEKETLAIPLPRSCLAGLVHRYKGLILVPLANDSGHFVSIYSRSVSGRIPTITYFYGNNKRVFNATQNTFIVDTFGLDLREYEHCWLGSGYQFRTYLRFNLDSLKQLRLPEGDSLSLPIDTGATVLSAALKLYPESTFALNETIYIGARRLNRRLAPESRSPSLDSLLVRQLFIVRQDSVIALDIRPIVQYWFQKPDSNFGLLLSVEPMGTRMELARVELKRARAWLPRLLVVFAPPPKGRFGS